MRIFLLQSNGANVPGLVISSYHAMTPFPESEALCPMNDSFSCIDLFIFIVAYVFQEFIVSLFFSFESEFFFLPKVLLVC